MILLLFFFILNSTDKTILSINNSVLIPEAYL